MLHRAINICSEKYVDREIEFLINVFIENGFENDSLQKMVNEIRKKPSSNPVDLTNNATIENIPQRITLPWIPGVSPKLRSVYKKAGYDIAFKSGIRQFVVPPMYRYTHGN